MALPTVMVTKTSDAKKTAFNLNTSVFFGFLIFSFFCVFYFPQWANIKIENFVYLLTQILHHNVFV